MKAALVTTTIRVPTNLEAYARDIAEYGPEDTQIIVAGDLKTPAECKDWCQQRNIIYLGVEETWLRDNFLSYAQFLPWNCVQRRNAAILYAYHNGAEVIVTIDDDNLWNGERYFEQHATGKFSFEVIENDWINVCHGAVCKHGEKFYPRGFSFSDRHKKEGAADLVERTGRIVVNAGLWTGDPDIDAVTRLAIAPEVISYNFNRIILGKNAKCPFNSQNTALHRDVIPAYCLSTGVGRYDDIIASYVVTRIAHHLGDFISFGRPVVHQVRNPHNVYRDLNDELLGMLLIDRIVDWLYDISLTGKDYKSCTIELIDGFEKKINEWFIDEAVPNEQQIFLRSIVTNYRHWTAIT